MNKKGDITLEKLLKVLLVVAVVLVVAYFVITNFKSFGEFFRGYSRPQITQDNNYFSAEQVGFMKDGKFLDMSKGELPSNCKSNGPSKITCFTNAVIDTYVIIHNTGFKTRDFFPRPIIGYGCNDKNVCDIEEPIENSGPCSVLIDKRENCPTGSTYTLSKTGEYRIYPGAKCLAQDCYDPAAANSKDLSDPGSKAIIYQNKNSYITIEVEGR